MSNFYSPRFYLICVRRPSTSHYYHQFVFQELPVVLKNEINGSGQRNGNLLGESYQDKLY